jgi:hypothetical protein
MAKLSPPEQYDPLVGTVYGNILDLTDNYVYTAKLYMIPPVTSSSTTVPSVYAGQDARQTTASSGSSTSGTGGYIKNFLVANPAETVVLAQTGVTGTQIDNIEITAAKGPGGATFTSKVTFDIIQPGMANFLDQIIIAKTAIGAPTSSNDVPLFLEIMFKGYSADMTNNDEGGEPIVLAGPYRYRLAIGKVSVEINQDGSMYSFECVPIDTISYTDRLFRMPKTFSTEGKTITAHVESLERYIKDYYELNNTTYAIKDELLIDLSGITGGEYGLSNLEVDSNVNAEEINRLINPELEGKTPEEYEEILKANTKDKGTLDIIVSQDRIMVREGVTIDRYISTLLSMNAEFFNKLTRKINPDLPNDRAVDREKALINWFKINAGLEYIDFDYFRNEYAKRVYYKPLIYASARGTTEIIPEENASLNTAEVSARVAELNILKSYHYLLTGLNDQIYACDIKYNAGHAILHPPAGGVSGDISTTSPSLFRSYAVTNEDLSYKSVAAAAALDNAATRVSTLVDRASAGDLASVARVVGLSDEQTKQAIQDRNSASAQALKNALSNSEVAAAIAAEQEQRQNNTSSDNIKGLDGSNYAPTASGYIYAEDLIGNLNEALNRQVILLQTRTQIQSALSAVAAEEARATETRSSGFFGRTVQWFSKFFSGTGNAADTAASVMDSAPASSEAADATYNGITPRNTIFGYLMQQNSAEDFLVTLDLSVKGDPWYLGTPDLTGKMTPEISGSELRIPSTPEALSISGDDQYVLFELQVPRQFDYDIVDEDNNTGYWTQEGTAYFISGVYFIKNVVNRFSDGVFTQDLKLIKQTELRTSVMEKKPYNNSTE